MTEAIVRSINVGLPVAQEWAGIGRTSIDKHAIGSAYVERLGVAGDHVSDTRHHGGLDQAVYAYAREDLDWWETELGRPIRDGQFGENITTVGIDVNAAEVGEQWRVGGALLEVASVRVPCNDFKNWQRVNGYDDTAWVKRFSVSGRIGPYLRVLEEGEVTGGDPIEVIHRPGHGISVTDMFRILTVEHDRLPDLLDIDTLTAKARAKVDAHLAS